MTIAASTLTQGSEIGVTIGGNATVPTQQLGFFYTTFVANSTTAVVVTDSGVTASSIIIPTVVTASSQGSTPPYCSAITAGTSFSMKAASSDVSTYGVLRIG